MPKTKIIATLGPSSSNETIIRKMIFAGMDVARLNFSHGNTEAHQKRLDIVRHINQKYRRKVKILQDLEGNRIRIGKLQGAKLIELKKRDRIWLVKEEITGNTQEVHLDYQGSFFDIKSGSDIFIDDGNIRLKAKRVYKNKILAEVSIGGWLKERKGVNIPHAALKFPRITEKDARDIQFGIKNNVEYIAQSFVRDKYDCFAVRKLFSRDSGIPPRSKYLAEKDKFSQCLFVAKVESAQAIKNIDEIIEASDGILIARGDMGICVPIWEIPIIQKMIIRKCNQKRKPVITATQMLENMVNNPQPTRAEVTDVANAVLDGTSMVMLSAESAAGSYPVESVRMMNRIIIHTEASPNYLRQCL